MIYSLFGFLSVAASILLIFIVLVQNSKGGGLSGTFGASNLTSMIGTRSATQDVEKITWYLAAGLMITAFLANVSMSGTVINETKFGNLMQAPVPVQAPAPPPTTNPIAPPAGGGATPPGN